MSYSSSNPGFSRALWQAKTCPYLVFDNRCAGGDYCPYPPGRHMMCCLWCPLFHNCPDKTGVCARFMEE